MVFSITHPISTLGSCRHTTRCLIQQSGTSGVTNQTIGPLHLVGPLGHTPLVVVLIFSIPSPVLNQISTGPILKCEAILSVQRFWYEKGIDGFRLDVFNAYCKDMRFQNNPRRRDLLGFCGGFFYGYIGQEHIYDRDRPELMSVLKAFRSLADEYDAVLIGETLDERFEYSLVKSYVGVEKLHVAFDFLRSTPVGDAYQIRFESCLQLLNTLLGCGVTMIFLVNPNVGERIQIEGS